MALEFGTADPITVLQALRADAVLDAHGDPTGPDAGAIRAQVRAAFADDRPEWIAEVLLLKDAPALTLRARFRTSASFVAINYRF